MKTSHFRSIADTFCHPAALGIGTSQQVRKLRREQSVFAKLGRDAYLLSCQAGERLLIVKQALANLPDEEKKSFSAELQAREEGAKAANLHYEDVSKHQEDLRKQLEEAEGDYARKEILHFVQSKRYEINSRTLANAFAGLPFMGWRQSMRRCMKRSYIIQDSTCISIFKAIRYLSERCPTKSNSKLMASHFRKNIPFLSARFGQAKPELAKNFYFMRKAIVEVCATKIERGALPYRITARYMKLMECQSALDVLLKEQESLV